MSSVSTTISMAFTSCPKPIKTGSVRAPLNCTPMWEGVVPSQRCSAVHRKLDLDSKFHVGERIPESGYGFLHASTKPPLEPGTSFRSNPWPNGYGFNKRDNPIAEALRRDCLNIVFSGDFNSYLRVGASARESRGPEGNFSLPRQRRVFARQARLQVWFSVYRHRFMTITPITHANGQVKFKHLQDFLDGNPEEREPSRG